MNAKSRRLAAGLAAFAAAVGLAPSGAAQGVPAEVPQIDAILIETQIREVLASTSSGPGQGEEPPEIHDAFLELVSSDCESQPLESGDYVAACDSSGEAFIVGRAVVRERDIVAATQTTNVVGAASVAVQLSDVGRQSMASYTAQHLRERMAIVRGLQICSAPMIEAEIPSGELEISFGDNSSATELLTCMQLTAVGPLLSGTDLAGARTHAGTVREGE